MFLVSIVIQYNCWKHTMNPKITIFYQFHDQKALFKVPKICNIIFGLKMTPPPSALFQKFTRFGSGTLPLLEYKRFFGRGNVVKGRDIETRTEFQLRFFLHNTVSPQQLWQTSKTTLQYIRIRCLLYIWQYDGNEHLWQKSHITLALNNF